jgi:hypothetical protein
MRQTDINELEGLVKDYDKKHGQGKGYEILGALMFSHSIADQIKLLRKSKGRRIVVTDVPGVVDGVYCWYL